MIINFQRASAFRNISDSFGSSYNRDKYVYLKQLASPTADICQFYVIGVFNFNIGGDHG